MENFKDLTIDNWKSLVIYYKDKAVELEWSSLLSQISHQKTIKENNDEYEKKIREQKDFFKNSFDDEIGRLEIKIDFLNKEIEKKDKEIQKLKNKNKK